MILRYYTAIGLKTLHFIAAYIRVRTISRFQRFEIYDEKHLLHVPKTRHN